MAIMCRKASPFTSFCIPIRLLIIAAILTDNCFSTAQTIVDIPVEDPSRYLLKTWGTDSVEQGLFLIPDGKKWIMGGVTYSARIPQVTLYKINRRMDVESTQILRDDSFRFPYSGIRANDGNFIFSGFIKKKGQQQFDALIFKTTPKGDTLWTRTFGGSKEERAYDLLAVRGGYLIVGNTASSGAGNLDGMLVRIDEDGKILWQKTFGGIGVDKFYSITQLPDNDVIVSGLTTDNYPRNSDIVLYRFNQNGDEIWKKVIATERGEFITSVSPYGDNKLFLAGHTLEKSATLGGLLFLHMDGDGQILTKEILQTNEDLKMEDGYLSPDGEFVATGFVRKSPNDNWNTFLLKRNIYSGLTRVTKIEYSEFHDECYQIIPVQDNEYFIVGQTMKNKGDNMLLRWSPK